MAPQPKKAPAAKEAKSASEKPAAKAASTSSSAPTTVTPAADTEATTGGYSKPDQAAYNNEQNELRTKIDALQAQLNTLKDKIALTTKGGPGADRRAVLRAELDGIKGQQSGIKGSRSKILDQLKAIQESSTKRAKDLQAAKSKAPFKTVADIDNHIRNQERLIESGSLNLTAEKKALADINTSKRSKKIVEGFQTEQDAIDADRARADELRKQLDDPESKAISDRFEAIKAELDALKAEGDEAFANRNKLFDERTALSKQLDELWTEKKEKGRLHKEAGDRYYKKVAEERAKKAERYAAQRQAAEDEKRQEIALRLKEEAEAPAYQAQIEDCQTLIDFLSIKAGGGAAAASVPTPALNGARSEIAGVPKLEGRTIDANANDGLVARKKKGEDEQNYFVAAKTKKKSAQQGKAATSNGATTPPSAPTEAKLNLPLPTLSALLSLSIPPPASTSDITRTIDDLKTKKEWFLANQSRVTAENIAKADAEIKRLENKSGANTPAVASNGKEHPAEPTPTPAVASDPSSTVEVAAVDTALEEVKESTPAEEAA